MQRHLRAIAHQLIQAVGVSPQVARDHYNATRLYLWRLIGERVLWVRLYLEGHARYWKARNAWLNQFASIENLQRVQAGFYLVVGVILMLTPNNDNGSFSAGLIDHVLPAFPYGIKPHQIAGLTLFSSGLLAIVSIMEWPFITEQESAVNDAFERNRLAGLLKLQLYSSWLAQAYWGANCIFTLIAHPFWIATWISGYLVLIHMWTYSRMCRQYAQDRFAARSAHGTQVLLSPTPRHPVS